MEHITQEVRDNVLSLIPHENHRKLANMLMDGVSHDEIKTHGFDQIQIDEYTSLINSVASGETVVPERPQADTTTQPEDTTTPENVSTPDAETPTEDKVEDAGQTDVPAQPEATQPETVQENQPENADTTTTEPETPSAEGQDTAVAPEGEIPA